MNKLLTRWVWPLIASVLTALLVMIAFEFTNMLMYPFPAGFDANNLEQVRAFTKTLPLLAFIMVLLGWTIGSFAAGIVASRLTQPDLNHGRVITLIAGSLLTALGLFNNFVFLVGVQPLWFVTLGTVSFIIFSYLGHHLFSIQFRKSHPSSQ